MSSGPYCRSALQIHPTRRCNLECLHCYSRSGPDVDEELPLGMLRGVLDDAADAGFTSLSVSGGEPTLYSALPELLRHARQTGMRTSMTTNGMLLAPRVLDALGDNLDALAISVDGVPASHNRLRAAGNAFEVMLRRLEAVRASGIPFGFIFTLTQHNLHELARVAEIAVEQGASMLQVHPLEEEGRAARSLSGARPDETEVAYAFVAAMRLQAAHAERLAIQLDLADVDALREAPGRVFADEVEPPPGAPFASLVSPLVVEASGWVVPIQHGFDRHFALGSLHEQRLANLMRRWREERHVAFRDVCRETFKRETAARELPLFNWNQAVMHAARHAAGSPARTTTASTPDTRFRLDPLPENPLP